MFAPQTEVFELTSDSDHFVMPHAAGGGGGVVADAAESGGAADDACPMTAALRAVLRLKTSLANCLLLSQHAVPAVPIHDCVVMQLLDTQHQRSNLSPPLFSKYASLLTLLRRWFSAASSVEQRQLVDWPPAWPITNVIRTKSHPDRYTRVTLKDRLVCVKTARPFEKFAIWEACLADPIQKSW